MFTEVYTSKLIDIPERTLPLRITSILWMVLNQEKFEDTRNQKPSMEEGKTTQ